MGFVVEAVSADGRAVVTHGSPYKEISAAVFAAADYYARGTGTLGGGFMPDRCVVEATTLTALPGRVSEIVEVTLTDQERLEWAGWAATYEDRCAIRDRVMERLGLIAKNPMEGD